MRKREVVKIDDKEIVLKELTIMELMYFCHRMGWISSFDKGKEKQFDKYENTPIYDVALSLVSDISKGELMVFTPSEIKTLYDAFKKVNEVTFDAAKYMGIDQIINDMKDGLTKHFMSDYSNLLK